MLLWEYVMAKEIEGQTLREYGIRKKRIRQRKKLILSLLFLIVILAGGIFIWKLYNKSYSNYEIINTMSNEGIMAKGYVRFGYSFIKYSRDGALAYDKDKKLLWNGSYDMKNPIADVCNSYAVVADKGNKSLYIFDRKGVVNNIETIYDIVNVKIANQGVVAVLMEADKDYYIYFYNKEGNEIIHMKNNVGNAGYPIDIALSQDGEKLVVSYMSVTKGKLSSSVAFYNFGEVGQNSTDGFVGGWDFDDIVVPKVTFLNNDRVCVFKENGIMLYAMSELPVELYQEDFDQKIKSVLHNESYAGVVLDKDENNPRKLLLYNDAGKRVLESDLDFDYDKIYLAENEIIMHDNLTCQIMRIDGRVKFKNVFTSNIDVFYPANNLNKYYLVNDSEVSEVLLLE